MGQSAGSDPGESHRQSTAPPVRSLRPAGPGVGGGREATPETSWLQGTGRFWRSSPLQKLQAGQRRKEKQQLITDRFLELSFFIKEHVHFKCAHFWSFHQVALGKSLTVYLSIKFPRAFWPVTQMITLFSVCQPQTDSSYCLRLCSPDSHWHLWSVMTSLGAFF